MNQVQKLDRRGFLRAAGTAACVGVATEPFAASQRSGVVPATDQFEFDEVLDRVGTNSVKWDRHIGRFGRDNIEVGMGIADMDFRVAPAVSRAIEARMRHQNWGYLDSMEPFVATVVNWNKRRYGLDIRPESLVFATGVHAGIVAALQTFSPRGSKVLLQTPTYNGFYFDVAFAGCVAEDSPLKLVNGRYQMDFEDLERRIGPDTRTLILCNPQNPTGNCWSREDLTTLGEICLRRGVVVLADEIHCDFTMPGQKYVPFASLSNAEVVNNSITFTAASKSFGLAAMKCGWFFSTNRDYLARIRANHRADISTLGLIASQAGYEGGETWLAEVVRYIDGNLDLVESFLAKQVPLVRCVKPQGTYLAWLDCRLLADRIGAEREAAAVNAKHAAGTPAITPEQVIERFFVMRAKVQMNQGRAHGRGGEGHMRMNVATSRRLVEKALSNIARATDGV